MAFLPQQLVNQYLESLGPAMYDEYMYTFDMLMDALYERKDRMIRALFIACGGRIGREYLNHIYAKAEHGHCELVVSLDRPATLIDDGKLGCHVRGLLCVEVGECADRPDMPCIALICSAHRKGNLLMGLFLHALNELRERGGPGVGALELAAGYVNLSGLCLYSKFGFLGDLALLKPNCFASARNMPMSVDLARFGDDGATRRAKIRAIVLGEDPGFPREPACGMRGKAQELYAAIVEVARLEMVLPEDQMPHELYTYSDRLVDVNWLRHVLADGGDLWQLVDTFDTLDEAEIDWMYSKCILPVPPLPVPPLPAPAAPATIAPPPSGRKTPADPPVPPGIVHPQKQLSLLAQAPPRVQVPTADPPQTQQQQVLSPLARAPPRVQIPDLEKDPILPQSQAPTPVLSALARAPPRVELPNLDEQKTGGRRGTERRRWRRRGRRSRRPRRGFRA